MHWDCNVYGEAEEPTLVGIACRRVAPEAQEGEIPGTVPPQEESGWVMGAPPIVSVLHLRSKMQSLEG